MRVSEFFENVYPLMNCNIGILANKDEECANVFIGYLVEHNHGISKELFLKQLYFAKIKHIEHCEDCINLVLDISPDAALDRLTEIKDVSAHKLYKYLIEHVVCPENTGINNITFDGMNCSYEVEGNCIICNTIDDGTDTVFDVSSFLYVYRNHQIDTIKVILPRKIEKESVKFTHDNETSATNVKFN